jgi:hypothetical protein
VSRDPAGTVLTWYIIGYGVGRFFFEFMRGDPARPYWGGFSEGQWTSIALMLVVVGIERLGVLPYSPVHVVALAVVVVVMAAIGVSGRRHQKTAHRLLNPRHVREIACALQSVPREDGEQSFAGRESRKLANAHVQSTSQGIQISSSRYVQGPERVQHYAVSCRDGSMTDEIANIIAGLIFTIMPGLTSRELVKGKNGVYHLLLRL